MCGIIGYVGNSEAKHMLINGLNSMEYRGYDSSGMCLSSNDCLSVLKMDGPVANLFENTKFIDLQGFLGIAHNRWATHGEPNIINAHPHIDCTHNIAIAHNGIIENYDSLKEMLKTEGHVFTSETDSEVLAHLVEKFYDGDLISAVKKALVLVEGTYALLVIAKDTDKIIAAKRGSPLLIGVGNNEMFVASDVAALIKNTQKVIYMEDCQIAEISKSGYSITDMEGVEVNAIIHDVKLTSDSIEKGTYKHFMLKEIYEQPEILKKALQERSKEAFTKLSSKIPIPSLRRIILLGCGTSWHSALVGKYLFEKIAGIPADVDYSSEFRYRTPLLDKKDLVIVISQSGETADTLAALREAKSKGAHTLGIVNVVGSSIAREVDSVIYLRAGPEIGVASTKAFTSQILQLILLSLNMREENKENSHLPLMDEIEKIPLYIEEILKNIDSIKSVTEMLKESKTVLFLGRGFNYPVALEGALKLKEISYIHAEGYPAAEIKHGPIALIDENVPVIFLAPKNHTYEKILSNIQEVKARKGKIIVIINETEPSMTKLADAIIKIPFCSEEISVILNAIVLQIFAYYIADAKGINVDKPKNLAKSVTVE